MAGIIDTIKLAGVLVLAIPAALAGLDFLLVRGETTTGAVLLVLAVGLVAIEQYLTTPGDVPGLVAKRVGKAVVETDTETEASADGDDPEAAPDDPRVER